MRLLNWLKKNSCKKDKQYFSLVFYQLLIPVLRMKIMKIKHIRKVLILEDCGDLEKLASDYSHDFSPSINLEKSICMYVYLYYMYFICIFNLE